MKKIILGVILFTLFSCKPQANVKYFEIYTPKDIYYIAPTLTVTTENTNNSWKFKDVKSLRDFISQQTRNDNF